MTGVEILSLQTIYNTILPGWCGALAFALMIASCIGTGVFSTYRKLGLTITSCVLIVVSVVVMTLTLSSNHNSVNHIEYKVTIDDSVSMNEFLDKYEILDQEGKIYTVKEKN
jgi:hypothetical protein